MLLVAYSVEKAQEARDALVKALYGNLFQAIIDEINVSLQKSQTAAGHANIIGVLDIFGFESFEKNSFEQLCINFCNEKLQFHFNEHIFRLEQEVRQRKQKDIRKILKLPLTQDSTLSFLLLLFFFFLLLGLGTVEASSHVVLCSISVVTSDLSQTQTNCIRSTRPRA